MAPHSPCQCHEKSDRRSETDPRSRQCHRDEIPGKATNSEKQKKQKEGERKTMKSESESTKTKRVARSNPKEGKTVKLRSDHEEPRKRGGKTKSKTKANRRKGQLKDNESRQTNDDRLDNDRLENETQRSEKQSDGLRPTDSSRDIDQVG